VKLSITAGDFVRSAHKVRVKGRFITYVDGYRAEYGFPDLDTALPHIQTWRISWGGKCVVIPKGLYSSVFLPQLGGIEVGPSKNGKGLLILMTTGEDAVTYDVAFIITKDGKARRVTLRCHS
jgi:hypothetical protein